VLWGEYSGVGTFEHAFLHHGVPAEKLSEDNILKQRVLRHRFPTADLSDRAGSSGSTIRAPSVLVAAGLPCQPFAPGGSKLAEHDERADGVTNDVPDAVASLGERYISVDVEEHETFLSTGSVVLERFDARLAANRPPLVRSPSRPCLFDSVSCNGKIRRPRCALRWELTSVVARIGEAPPLRPILALRSRIRDIALPDNDIRPEQYVDGVLTLVDHCVSHDHPTVAATLVFGGSGVPIREGSRVRHPSYDFELVVVSYPDDPSLPLLLMRDKRGSVAYFPNHTRGEPFTNVATTFDVFSMEGIAASFTKMGVSPLGSAKQLWLRNGRAYAPDYRELVRLLECHPDILFPLHVDASLRSKDVDAIVGDMLSMQLAEAQAHRSVTREGQFRTAIALDVARTRGVDSLESRAALRFAPVAYGSSHDAFVVLVIQTGDGDLRALVSNDRRQLPVIPAADKPQPSRDSIVTAATRFCASLNANLGFDPHSFLVFSRPWLSVVACPLLGVQPGVENEFSAWLTIDEVADCDVYLPVASAMSRVAAYCQRGMPIALADVADGAMAPRPLLALPYAPSAQPSAWPAQLHYLECVDTHLRRVLTTVSRSHRHRQYLLDWVPQIDTAPNADIPPSLRGLSMSADDETAFVDVPFYDPCPVQSIPKPTFPGKQRTSHRPRSIEQILYPWAIRKLAKELRPIIAIMKLDRDKLPVPDWLRAQLKTIVIGQDGFLPEARGIVWDLRSKHPDGYFLPLDFEAPIDTHLHARAFFDALGDEYPDQSLRYQILNGALFFADLALQIVICPHLLSLSHAFANAENDIARLASLGYLEIVNAEHPALDDGDLIVALGLLPIRCTSQGTRAKKLRPDAPRRIANASGPHKKLSCGMKVPVLPLNEAIALRSLVDGKPKFNPECKPGAPGVMSDICVLQVPARILREPILQFNDDSSDAFNQFHLHRSQIYMTSILWLKINDIASRCEYSHILEYSLGYGFANASGFCQRFGDALLFLVARQMRALERSSRSAVTDTSLLEWFKRRDALGPNQSDLFRTYVYTDDPHFIAVGFERLVRLLSCWRDVTLMVGLRMAVAAKRQGGTSILWVGLRFHGTFGAVVIPPPKRARAIAELRRMHLGDDFTVEDAMSIAGLIEHLTPFASELRSSNYHLYYPHKAFAKLGMQYSFPPTDAMRSQARKWMERLIQRPGIACVAVRVLPREGGGSVVVMSSDAAKDGTPTPGVGGHMHGMSWYLPLSPEDVAALPINWLEFLGIYGNFVIFGPSIPLMHTRVLALTDSLTSALVLSKHSAKSEGMQMIHLRLLDEAEFVRLAAITDIAHVFGPGNIFSDAVSRGYFDMVEELCRQCHTAHEWLVVPPKVHNLLADLRALARDLATRANRELASRPLSKEESQRSRSHRHANKGSYGPTTNERASQFPSFRQATDTPPTPRYGTPTNAPVSFVSFAARPPAPAHHVRVVRPAPASPSAPITVPSAVPALTTNAKPSPPRAAAGNVARFALRRDSPSAFPKFTRSEPTPPPSVPRLRAPLVGPPRPPAVATVSFRSRSFAAPAVTHSFHVLPPPPSGRSRPVASSEQSDSADLLALLQCDTSKYALCPGDPGMLAGLMRDVGSAVRRSVRPNTQRKDRSSWRKWVAFCRMLNTPEVRDCVDAHAGLDTSGARRERFLQAAFFLYAFRTMVPRNRAHHTAKPASARACLDSVRRVHKHMDIVMCPAPSVALVLKGLMDEYVHLHGAEILVPRRREPLTNQQTVMLLSIAAGTKLGKHTVDWSSPLFVNFAAFLTALRHSGSRKADLLCVAPEDFDASSMSKWNLKWFIDGDIVDCPTPEQLRNLGPGDAAIIIPGCTKADPFAVMFGDKPIYLPFHPTDPCNAAARLARLELQFPVPANQRRHVPLFVSDAAGTPMSHAVVDAIFAAACLCALGASVARTLSLHSGRVWLACALLAAGHSTATIQAMCRWLSPAAVRIYAHMNPEAAMSTLDSAMSAAITSRLSSNIPPCDADSQVRAVSQSLDSPSIPAGSFRPPRPRARSAPAGSTAGSDSEDDLASDAAVGCLVAESGMCDKGAPLAPAEVKKGALVAVPFALGSHHVHYSGTISAVISSTEVRVAFPGERPWLIARNRLFHVVSLDDTADDA